jgi:hypothetical protein
MESMWAPEASRIDGGMMLGFGGGDDMMIFDGGFYP